MYVQYKATLPLLRKINLKSLPKVKTEENTKNKVMISLGLLDMIDYRVKCVIEIFEPAVIRRFQQKQKIRKK